MKNRESLSFVAILLGIAAIVLHFLGSPSVSTRAGTRASLPTSARSMAELTASVETLQAENGALAERLELLELRSSSTVQRTPADQLSVQELRELRAEVLAALDELKRERAGPGTDDVLEERVASTLAEIRRDEAVAGALLGLEKRTESVDGTLRWVGEWLEVAPHQVGAMRRVLLAQYERERGLVERWDAEEDPATLARQKEADRDLFRSELEAVLTPEQMERARGALPKLEVDLVPGSAGGRVRPGRAGK